MISTEGRKGKREIILSYYNLKSYMQEVNKFLKSYSQHDTNVLHGLWVKYEAGIC